MVAIIISLVSLVFTVFSNFHNRRLSVLPFIQYELVEWGGKPDDLNTANNDGSTYRIFVDNDGNLHEVTKWNKEHLKIMKGKEMNGVTFPGSKVLPRSLKMKNIGKGVAVNFSIKINDKRASTPKQIQEEEEFIITILSENERGVFEILMTFRDIYNHWYVEKIEYIKGMLAMDMSLKYMMRQGIEYKIDKYKQRKNLLKED